VGQNVTIFLKHWFHWKFYLDF